MPPRSADSVQNMTMEAPVVAGAKLHPLLTRSYAAPTSFEEHILRTSPTGPLAIDLGQQPLRREGSLGREGLLKESGRDAIEASPGNVRQSDRLFDAPMLTPVVGDGAAPRPSRQFDRAFDNAGSRHCDRTYESAGGSRQQHLVRVGSLTAPQTPKQPERSGEVTLHVGPNRTPYTVCVETLRNASYFRALVEKRQLEASSAGGAGHFVVDCEESLFQNVLCVLRYRTWEALPAMSDADVYKLKKELEYFGVPIPDPSKKLTPPSTASGSSSVTVATEPTAKRSSGNSSPSCSPSNSVSSSSSSSPNASPNRHRQQKQHPHRFQSTDLPDLPPELSDPSKLVLVTRTDGDPRATCEHCVGSTSEDQVAARTCWALSFQYRHAFCTRCGQPAPSTMAPKFLAEIFLTAATYYSECTSAKGWTVGSNSTCSLKFLNAKPCCPCSRSSKASTPTTWAVSSFHSHAFCTNCGLSADGVTLVSLLLTLKYGGLQRKVARKDHNLDMCLDSAQSQMQAQHGKNSHLRTSNVAF